MADSSVNQVTLTMPQLGETMERGTVAHWLINEGHAFKRGDSIVEFETDKTAVEYPALGDGVLLQQLVKPGDLVEVGEPIAWIDIGEGPDWISETQNTQHAANGLPSIDTRQSEDSAGDNDSKQSNERSETLHGIAEKVPSAANENSAIRATPVARKRARHLGVPLESISGSGRRGRIEEQDVDAQVADLRSIEELKPTKDLKSTKYEEDATRRELAFENTNSSDLHYLDGIAYRVSGPKTGLPVLMLHGFAADATTWGLLSRTLVKAGCRVLTVDLPGHGATESEAPDVEALSCGLLNVLLANSIGSCRWHVVAHSLGAVPALELAQSDADCAVKSLTLIAPVGLGLSIDRQFIEGMAKPSSVAELSHLLRRLSNQPPTMSNAAVRNLFHQLKQGRLEKLAESMLGRQGQALNHHDAIRALSKQFPVRLVIGHADRIVNWQDALTVAPSVAVHHFPTAGHMPHWDNPVDVAQIILSSG